MRLRVRALAALFGIGGLSCLLSALFPMSAGAPVGLATVVGAAGLATAAAFLVAGPSLPRAGIDLALLAATVMTCVLVARAATDSGAILSALVLPWIGGYAASFLSTRETAGQLLAMSVGFAIALLLAGADHAPRIWVMLMASAWGGSLVLARASARLQAMAQSDPLTGLPNRQGLERAATREAAIAARRGEPLTVAMLDLDNFKQVNDTRGHAAGDALLVEATRAWQDELRGGDVIARIGGDEFVMLLPGSDPAEADRMLERIEHRSPTGFSAGSTAWGPGDELDRCLRRADAGLLAEKERRREAAQRRAPGGGQVPGRRPVTA